MEMKSNLTSKTFQNRLELISWIVENSLIKASLPDYTHLNSKIVDGNLIEIHLERVGMEDSDKESIKILQILNVIIIYLYEKKCNRYHRIKFNIDEYFRRQQKNWIDIKDITEMDSWFVNEEREKKFQNLLSLRIIKNLNTSNSLIKKDEPRIMTLSDHLVVKILGYLLTKDLLNFLSLNMKIYRSYHQNNEFWMILHNKKFKKTGFGVSKLDWKTIYIKKMKENK
jgi:hypothetical protein